MTAHDVLNFWFEEIDSSLWFKKDDSFDQLVTQKFLGLFQQALAGQLSAWRKNASGRLAEVIVLDQFPRNMFRGSAQSFSGDQMALNLAREAVRLGEDEMLSSVRKAFLYMPYMHSESKQMHQEAVKLFSQEGLESNLSFELAHKKIIDTFGRYPHRNEILGRLSTPQEIEFLKTPNSSF